MVGILKCRNTDKCAYRPAMRRHGLLREKAPAPAAHSIRRPPKAGRGLFAPTLKGRWVDHMLFKASENSLRDCRAGYSRWAGAVARLRVVSSSMSKKRSRPAPADRAWLRWQVGLTTVP